MIVYSDLDGTMLGPAGSFFHDEDRAVTLAPSRARADLLDADVPLVLVSGRTRAQLIEAGAIFAADGFIAELGALVAWDRGRQHIALPGEGPPPTPALVQALLAAYPGRLEFHDPWHAGHEMDAMLRGNVALDEVHSWLVTAGAGHLTLRDNGVLPPSRPTGLDRDLAPTHVYHLLARGISKGTAVAYDLDRRGADPADAIAIGDSVSDLEMAGAVGRFFLVENGARSPSTRKAAASYTNVTVTTAPLCLGWAEAVRSVIS